MSSQREIEDRFETLDNCKRMYENGKYAVGDFHTEDEYVVVHTEQGGFNILTGTNEDAVDVLKAFNRNFPESGEILYSEGAQDFRPIRRNTEIAEMPEVKYVGDTYGVVWHDHPRGQFPDKDYVVAVFSNEENFQYSMESAEVIGDVFPEITEIEQNNPILNEVMTMAAIDMDEWQ